MKHSSILTRRSFQGIKFFNQVYSIEILAIHIYKRFTVLLSFSIFLQNRSYLRVKMFDNAIRLDLIHPSWSMWSGKNTSWLVYEVCNLNFYSLLTTHYSHWLLNCEHWSTRTTQHDNFFYCYCYCFYYCLKMSGFKLIACEWNKGVGRGIT